MAKTRKLKDVKLDEQAPAPTGTMAEEAVRRKREVAEHADKEQRRKDLVAGLEPVAQDLFVASGDLHGAVALSMAISLCALRGWTDKQK